MQKSHDDIALLDMDGTIADYDLRMQADLEKLRSPEEKSYTIGLDKRHPPYIKARMDLITSSGDWWENLPKFQLGFDLLEMLQKLEFYVSILTQGPKDNPVAWSHKVRWCKKNVPDLDIAVTRRKGLVYGKVLIDDYLPYILDWLEWRPRGVVIMPAHPWNEKFSHPNVFRYDGKNKKDIWKILQAVKKRKMGERWENPLR